MAVRAALAPLTDIAYAAAELTEHEITDHHIPIGAVNKHALTDPRQAAQPVIRSRPLLPKQELDSAMSLNHEKPKFITVKEHRDVGWQKVSRSC